MSQPVIADLLARIQELERAGGPTPTSVPRRRSPRRRRVALAVVALAGLLLVPVGVFATHQFTDVSTSNTFHASISKVRNAGITSGCTATKFCPADSVTRGQMAAFLARTAARAETGFFFGSALTTEEQSLATFEVKAGEATGGTAAVTVVASVSVSIQDVTGCPCTAAFFIDSDSAPYTSFNQYATVTEANIDIESVAYGIATTSVTVLLQIPTGVTETVYLVGYMVDGAPLEAWGEMVGTVALFDGLGNNVTVPIKTTGGATSGPGSRADD